MMGRKGLKKKKKGNLGYKADSFVAPNIKRALMLGSSRTEGHFGSRCTLKPLYYI